MIRSRGRAVQVNIVPIAVSGAAKAARRTTGSLTNSRFVHFNYISFKCTFRNTSDKTAVYDSSVGCCKLQQVYDAAALFRVGSIIICVLKL